MRLLVVEDESRMLELLRRGLTEEGHTVCSAMDGSGALLELQKQEFDAQDERLRDAAADAR